MMDKKMQIDEALDNIQQAFYFSMENYLVPNSGQSENGRVEQLASEGEDAEENLISKFQARMCTALSETKMTMLEEFKKFNLAKDDQSKSLISQTKHKFAEEKNDLLQKLNSSKLHCESLESGLKTKDTLIKNLIEKLDYQQKRILMSKVFNAWRRHTETKKRKDMLCAIAVRHYEQNLKRRMFHCWHEVLKKNWMQRIELQANVEILEAQKQVVSLYENKIRYLEESLTEAGRKIDKLLQKPKDNPPRTAPPRCVNPPINNFNFHTTEPVSQLDGYRTMYQRPMTSPGALCEECSTQTYGQVAGNYFAYPVAAPAVSYAVVSDEVVSNHLPPIKSHPSTQPKSTLVTNSLNLHKTGSPAKKNDAPKGSKPLIMVERHLPRNQVICGPMSTMSAATQLRNQCHKKTE